ncbi:MAG: glycosyltransferase family 4 protein [bacterium]|nr:glycosyltransferase family 4 protein [bacterium]
MRIALLADGIWPDTIGGMQKHSFYLAKYFALNGIKVDLFYCANDAALVIKQFSFDETLNIRFFKVNFPKVKFSFPGHYVYNSYRYSKRIYQLYIKQGPYDFIYSQGFTGWYFVKMGVQLGSNLHGLEMYQKAFGLKSKLAQFILRIPANTIIRKSAISFSLGGKLTQILTTQKALKIRETPIGIGEEWLFNKPVSNTTINFIFVGRNEKRKGLDLLFQALQKLDDKQFIFHFIGIDKPTIISESKHLIFHGELRDAEKIRGIVSQCDCLVSPSIAEGMPTVILEAMAMNLAVIATDTGATSLLVGKQNGLLIQPDNLSQLIESLQYFCQIPSEELHILKQSSYKIVAEKYIWPVSIQVTINALKP